MCVGGWWVTTIKVRHADYTPSKMVFGKAELREVWAIRPTTGSRTKLSCNALNMGKQAEKTTEINSQ